MVLSHRGPYLEGDFTTPGLPDFNPMHLLHGEENLIIEKPLVPDKKYVVHEHIADVQDKKKGALVVLD